MSIPGRMAAQVSADRCIPTMGGAPQVLLCPTRWFDCSWRRTRRRGAVEQSWRRLHDLSPPRGRATRKRPTLGASSGIARYRWPSLAASRLRNSSASISPRANCSSRIRPGTRVASGLRESPHRPDAQRHERPEDEDRGDPHRPPHLVHPRPVHVCHRCSLCLPPLTRLLRTRGSKLLGACTKLWASSEVAGRSDGRSSRQMVLQL